MSQKYRRAAAPHAGKIAQEPARQIDQVRPLVDQFSPAGTLRLARHSRS